MALAAANDRPRKRRLAAVENGQPQASLADRLAAAEAAVTGPRTRVSELEAALAAAIEASDFAAAADVQEELPEAREALALALAERRILAEAQATVERERQEAERALAEARQRDAAQRVVEDAAVEEQQKVDARDAGLAETYELAAATQAAYERTCADEEAIQGIRQRAVEAQVDLGEVPAPGPRVFAPNKARSLRDTDPLIAALVRWRRP